MKKIGIHLSKDPFNFFSAQTFQKKTQFWEYTFQLTHTSSSIVWIISLIISIMENEKYTKNISKTWIQNVWMLSNLPSPARVLAEDWLPCWWESLWRKVPLRMMTVGEEGTAPQGGADSRSWSVDRTQMLRCTADHRLGFPRGVALPCGHSPGGWRGRTGVHRTPLKTKIKHCIIDG